MPFVETNGITMYYEVHGRGPAVVLAHPGGGSHLSWWQQVPVFAESFTCITFDHRGHGLTRDVSDDPGAHAYPQDLLGLLDHLEIEKAALVGQSMGGWTSIGLAALQPQRVSALVMGDSTGGIRDSAVDQHMARHAQRQGTPDLGRSLHPAVCRRQAGPPLSVPRDHGHEPAQAG